MSKVERTSRKSARATRRYALPPEKLLAVVERAVGDLPRWSVLVSHGRGLRAQRKTRVFRFTNTITIRVMDWEDASSVSFESVSEAGGHDLGQNRRNLKEDLGAMNQELRQQE